MNIIGFDLSTKFIGWCALDDGLYFAHKEVALRGEFSERMAAAFNSINDVCAYATPDDIIAIETPFVGRNSKTALQLGLMRGLAWAASLRRFCVAPVEVTPSEAKQVLTGDGKADKALMMRFAELQSGFPLPEHASDAYGVALAAWGKVRERRTLDAVGS